MSITSVKSGATGISLALDNNFMEPIATTLVGSGGVNTVIFNDIPQTYKHLQLRMLVRAASGASGRDNMALQFNGDTTNSNYASHVLRGDGASAFAESYITSYPIILRDPIVRDGSTASIYGVLIVDILDYASTSKNKTVRTLIGADANGSGNIALCSGLWMNSTDGINSIKVYDYDNNTYNFKQYSRFSLYGIKG